MLKEPKRPRPRGRPKRAEPASPSGYRLTETRRRALSVAMSFMGHRTLQAVIDDAVQGYLVVLRREVKGFAEAVDDAGASARKRSTAATNRDR